MILGLFAAFSASSDEIDFGPKVLHLTGLPPDDGTSYFVMIHKSGCSHCVQLAPSWKSAADLGEGLTKWAELNCDLNHSACGSLNVEAVPQTWLFLQGKIYPYPGMQLGRLFANFAALYVNDTAVHVDSSNFTVDPSTNAAILFTNKHPTPAIWTAVSNVVNRTDVTFYVSRDPTLKDQLSLDSFPGVYVVKSGTFHRYSGALAVANVAKFIRDLFAQEVGEL